VFKVAGTDRIEITGTVLAGKQANGIALRHNVNSSSTVPGYTFNNDLDTGIGRADADALSIITGGSERLRITSTGEIGIGTSAPSAKLHTLSTTEQLRLGYDTSNYVSTTVSSAGAVTIDAVGSGSIFSFADNVGIGTNAPQGKLQLTSVDPHGGYVTQIYAASSGTLAGTTDKIELNIPAGWRITQCQLHVKTAVVDDAGDDTWSSELNDGSQEEVISAGSAAAQNTNVNHWADADTWGTLTDAETDILLTPNGGSFSSGEIEATCIAQGFDSWTNE
jgi:hypothetical protein